MLSKNGWEKIRGNNKKKEDENRNGTEESSRDRKTRRNDSSHDYSRTDNITATCISPSIPNDLKTIKCWWASQVPALAGACVRLLTSSMMFPSGRQNSEWHDDIHELFYLCACRSNCVAPPRARSGKGCDAMIIVLCLRQTRWKDWKEETASYRAPLAQVSFSFSFSVISSIALHV